MATKRADIADLQIPYTIGDRTILVETKQKVDLLLASFFASAAVFAAMLSWLLMK